LAELGPHALGPEGLLPSIQPESLHALPFPESYLVYLHSVVEVLARASNIHKLEKNPIRTCILRSPTGRAKLFTPFCVYS
ncbi:unnamed protein product, partial [Prunus brigantina]